MSAAAQSLAELASQLEAQGLKAENAHLLARQLAKAFGVRRDEVALLQLQHGSLVFLHPARLQHAGSIPLNSSISVAARTATTRRAEIINNFAQIRHSSVFESVDLSEEEAGTIQDRGAQVIQKLMTVPVLAGGKAVGVIQISRKGDTARAAGRDFGPDELQQLTETAAAVANCFKYAG